MQTKSMQTDIVFCKAPAKPPRLRRQLQTPVESEDRCSLSLGQLCQLQLQYDNKRDEEESQRILMREKERVQNTPPLTKQPRKRRIAPQPPPKPPPKPRKIRTEKTTNDDHCAFIEQLFSETTEAKPSATVVAGKLSAGKKHAIFALDVAALLINTLNILSTGYVGFMGGYKKAKPYSE